jgi:hypothetical protein
MSGGRKKSRRSHSRKGKGLSGGRKRSRRSRGSSFLGPIGDLFGLGMSGGRRHRKRSHRGGALGDVAPIINELITKGINQDNTYADKSKKDEVIRDLVDVLHLEAGKSAKGKQKYDDTIYSIDRKNLLRPAFLTYNTFGRGC